MLDLCTGTADLAIAAIQAQKPLDFPPDAIELKATWREDWVVNPDRRYTHGGVLATLIDIAADWSMVMRNGRGVPTIDLRIDYLRPGRSETLVAEAEVVRVGRRIGVVDAGTAFDLKRGLLQPITAQHPLDRHANVTAEYALRGACAPRRVLHHLLHPVQPIVVADPVDQCRQ